jgi:hypothetical protein
MLPEKHLRLGGRIHMVGIAIAMFIALVLGGANYYGWSDPDGKVRLALAASFFLGALCGYKGKSS